METRAFHVYTLRHEDIRAYTPPHLTVWTLAKTSITSNVQWGDRYPYITVYRFDRIYKCFSLAVVLSSNDGHRLPHSRDSSEHSTTSSSSPWWAALLGKGNLERDEESINCFRVREKDKICDEFSFFFCY